MSSKRSLQIIGTLAACSSNKPLEKVQQCLENDIPQNKRRKTDGLTEHVQGHWATELIQDLCAEEPVIEETKLNL